MNVEEMLIDIVSKIATIQTSLDTMKEDITRNNSEDVKFANKLEEYFEYAKNRQDSIKKGIEVRLDDHEKRIDLLEHGTSNKLLKWWNWTWDKLISGGLVIIGILLYKWLNLPKI